LRNVFQFAFSASVKALLIGKSPYWLFSLLNNLSGSLVDTTMASYMSDTPYQNEENIVVGIDLALLIVRTYFPSLRWPKHAQAPFHTVIFTQAIAAA
jgi:hypothetical protein